jgi:opacity protein-like surface antigen
MRFAFTALALAASTAVAGAADLGPPPVLRGAMPAIGDSIDWNGFYFGGFGAFKQLEHEARSSGQGMVQDMLRSTIFLNPGQASDVYVMRRTASNKTGFGVFAGYNFSYDEAVLGVEADYGKTRLNGQTLAGRDGMFTDNNVQYSYSTRTNANVQISDYGSARARVGIPMGNIMPFGSIGVAVARARFSNGARMDWWNRQLDATTGLPLGPWVSQQPVTLGTASKIRFGFGYAASLGVDVAITSNIFLRAELLHYNFGNIGDQKAIINTARAGAAVKF